MTYIEVLTVAQTVNLLNTELGTTRCWNNALADMRRGKVTSVLGCTLLPVGRRAGRPLYESKQVRAFIRAVRSKSAPRAHAGKPVGTIRVKIASGEKRHWEQIELCGRRNTNNRCRAAGTATTRSTQNAKTTFA